MEDTIDILPASGEDLPNLAPILPYAMRVDLISRVIFESEPYDSSLAERFSLEELKVAASNADAHVIKALLKSTGKVVGYAIIVFSDGVFEPRTNDMQPTLPKEMNGAFTVMIHKRLRDLYEYHMAGKQHAGQFPVI